MKPVSSRPPRLHVNITATYAASFGEEASKAVKNKANLTS